MHILILLLLSLSASARTITPVSGDYVYQTSPEYKAVLAQVKSFGEFTQMVKEQQSRPMSQGERMVEAAKARNRAILAKQYEAEKKKTIQPIDTRMVNEQWKAEVASTHENWKREVES